MNIMYAALLGVVEGITEFLPISSTAHLIVTSQLLRMPQTDFQKLFEVFIQGGAILAAVFLYTGYLLKHKAMIRQVIMSFIPTAIVGFIFYKIIKSVFFNSTYLIIGAIAAVGVLFLLLEYLIMKKKIRLHRSVGEMTPAQAILTGLAQALATIPGVSRSGIVMTYLMSQGYKREDSAVYSFILAVPTILAASAYDMFKMRHLLAESGGYLPVLLIGFTVAFAVAYVVMKWFTAYLQKNSLTTFGVYRIILAIILLFIW